MSYSEPPTFSALSEDSKQRYSFDDYEDVTAQLDTLRREIDGWIQTKLEGLEVHLWPGALDRIINFEPFKKRPNGEYSGIDALSQGEYRHLRMIYSLLPMLIQQDISWFYFDDADANLHPEWSRRFVSELLTSFQSIVAQLSERIPRITRRFTCILCTHSPFILSDLNQFCVLTLVRESSTRTRIIRAQDKTFAGNIGDMFHSQFFMDSTIGELASAKLNELIELLRRPNDPSWTDEARSHAKEVFNSVGDEVLRKLLQGKL